MTSPRVILANAGIHKIISPFLVSILFLCLFIFAPFALADAKSDYDYQYGQYRLNYPEFSLLKSDYLNTPSLDNQQKAMLAARQTILARDLTKASFTWYLMDLIATTKANYLPVQPIVSALGVSREFFLEEAQKSQGIVTQDDLNKFTNSYLKQVLHHDRVIKYGVMANKLSTLVRIQLDLKGAIENLLPKLPTPFPATLTERVLELQGSLGVIDGKIDLIANGLNLVSDESEADAEIFFSARVEKLIEIQTLQLDWITRLIDIEKNYGQSNG